MTVRVSKAGEYFVQGQPGVMPISKMGHYYVQGTAKRVIISKLTQYVITGPQHATAPAARRRPLHMP